MRAFEKWCDENCLKKNPEKVVPEQLDKIPERIFLFFFFFIRAHAYTRRYRLRTRDLMGD